MGLGSPTDHPGRGRAGPRSHDAHTVDEAAPWALRADSPGCTCVQEVATGPLGSSRLGTREGAPESEESWVDAGATAAMAPGVPVRSPWRPAGAWAPPGGHTGGSSGFSRAGAPHPWGGGVRGVRPKEVCDCYSSRDPEPAVAPTGVGTPRHQAPRSGGGLLRASCTAGARPQARGPRGVRRCTG